MEINGVQFSDELVRLSSNIIKFDNKFKTNLNIKIGKKTYFNDDFWDFTNKNLNDRKRYFYIYKFDEFNFEYKYYIKKVVLDLFVIEKNKPGTIYNDFSHIKAFIIFLQNKNLISVNLIYAKIVKEFFDVMKHLTERTKLYYRISLKYFFKEIEYNNEHLDFTEVFKYLDNTNIQRKNAEIESNKTPEIPDSMFEKMISLALKDIKNPKVTEKDKLIASGIVLLGEVGMRIEELQKLEANKVNFLTIEEEKIVSYLEFKTFKTIRNKIVGYRWTETYLSDKAKLAYDMMVKISRDARKTSGSNYIYLFHEINSPLNRKIYSQGVIRGHIRRFILRHYKEFDFSSMTTDEKKCLSTFTVAEKSLSHVGYSDMKKWIGKEVYYVKPHQFRVTVCTRLYRNNVPLEFIRKHMNHLVEDMTQHYIRIKTLENKKVKALEIIKEAINQSGDLLETDVSKTTNEYIKSELSNPIYKKDYEDINKFLLNNKFKIKKDLGEVLQILTASKTPLTEFADGFCARTALTNICERQEFISSIGDFYFGGVNAPCIDYLNITYSRFKEKAKVVRHNEQVANSNPVYSVEYKRELKALKQYINERLIPELNLVKAEIAKVGSYKFLSKYTELESIVKNIDSIMVEEIYEWIQ